MTRRRSTYTSAAGRYRRWIGVIGTAVATAVAVALVGSDTGQRLVLAVLLSTAVITAAASGVLVLVRAVRS